ncbi:MAG TPA: dTDP-glucose 4,6-dehydratase [Bdellovibrionota bacterium]|jgi:dTDP-glucose 4,6-dehydratase|nr:dTDP-glucose 4,6-dehydratase [Bdellovibrionota bacterium]
MVQKILVTGGCGFIGSAFVRHLIESGQERVINVDKITYAAIPGALAGVESSARYHWEGVDITEAEALAKVFAEQSPDAVVHFAAESHVDRSIAAPSDFVKTNVLGTFELLRVSLEHYHSLSPERQQRFRWIHVSTDEVFGPSTTELDEGAPYRPSSPYAATKAAADHLVNAWRRTYGLPTLIARSSNNYGPYQLPDKLVPKAIRNALRGEGIPLYADGAQLRDWMYVDDHVRALREVLSRGEVGASYHLASGQRTSNLEVVERICQILDQQKPKADGTSYASQIVHVADRPGHDFSYAMSTDKARRELGWSASTPLEQGLRQTIQWLLESPGRLG